MVSFRLRTFGVHDISEALVSIRLGKNRVVRSRFREIEHFSHGSEVFGRLSFRGNRHISSDMEIFRSFLVRFNNAFLDPRTERSSRLLICICDAASVGAFSPNVSIGVVVRSETIGWLLLTSEYSKCMISHNH